MINIWHNTEDAPRMPRRVSPTQEMVVIIGTWPIGPGQSVWVEWDASRGRDGRRQAFSNHAGSFLGTGPASDISLLLRARGVSTRGTLLPEWTAGDQVRPRRPNRRVKAPPEEDQWRSASAATFTSDDGSC